GAIVSACSTEPGQDTACVASFNTISHSPQCIIKSRVMPGECWLFDGCTACVLIQLVTPVQVTTVSLEHIPACVSPTGQTSNAPRDFTVWAYPSYDSSEGIFLGHYSYNNSGSRIQFFNIQECLRRTVQFIQFRFLTNNGGIYTCVYRTRVHGKIPYSNYTTLMLSK
ncbi:hypothetical protein L9F63_016736, partial [Diploptera punctata]